jgi:hypothetical protein
MGKELIMKQIAEQIEQIMNTTTRTEPPLSLPWQLKKSDEVISVIGEGAPSNNVEPTHNSSSRHKRVPVTRTTDFLW